MLSLMLLMSLMSLLMLLLMLLMLSLLLLMSLLMLLLLLMLLIRINVFRHGKFFAAWNHFLRTFLFLFCFKEKEAFEEKSKMLRDPVFFLASKNSSIFADAGNFFHSVDF